MGLAVRLKAWGLWGAWINPEGGAILPCLFALGFSVLFVACELRQAFRLPREIAWNRHEDTEKSLRTVTVTLTRLDGQGDRIAPIDFLRGDRFFVHTVFAS